MADLLTSELATAKITDLETKGYKFTSIETELPVSDVAYVGTSNGLYKVIDFVNKSGKGLLVLACGTISHGGNTVEIDIPITKSKIGMFKAGMEVQFTVTRKTESDPKRIKFIGLNDDGATVTDNLPDDFTELKAMYLAKTGKKYEGTKNKSSVKAAILAL
jgi:hypothetical protein